MSTPTDYLADVTKTDLMRVIVALSTEVYEMKDRLGALEGVLNENGIDIGALDQAVEPAAYSAERVRERDGFVERVFGALASGAGA